MYNQFGNPQFGYGQQAAPYLPDFKFQQQPQPAPQPQANVSWIYVNGIDGAKGQIVQPGQTAWMMDNSEPMIYVKAVDSMGTANLKAFRLTEINAQTAPATSNVDLSGYAHKSDIDGILNRLSALEDTIGGLNA